MLPLLNYNGSEKEASVYEMVGFDMCEMVDFRCVKW